MSVVKLQKFLTGKFQSVRTHGRWESTTKATINHPPTAGQCILHILTTRKTSEVQNAPMQIKSIVLRRYMNLGLGQTNKLCVNMQRSRDWITWHNLVLEPNNQIHQCMTKDVNFERSWHNNAKQSSHKKCKSTWITTNTFNTIMKPTDESNFRADAMECDAIQSLRHQVRYPNLADVSNCTEWSSPPDLWKIYKFVLNLRYKLES